MVTTSFQMNTTFSATTCAKFHLSRKSIQKIIFWYKKDAANRVIQNKRLSDIYEAAHKLKTFKNTKYIVLALLKGPSIKYVRKIFRKSNISNPMILTRTCAYQGVKNVSFRKILRTSLMDDPYRIKCFNKVC